MQDGMKWIKWLMVALCAVMLAHADFSSFSDFDFTAQPKLQGKEAKPAKHEQVEQENWAYEVTADNKSAKDYADVEFKYILFRKEALIGNAAGASKMVRKAGSTKTPAVAAHSRFTFKTEPIMIQKTQLIGRRWASGANSRDWDVLEGIWIKVFAGGKQVGEFTAPQGLASKEKWDGPEKP